MIGSTYAGVNGVGRIVTTATKSTRILLRVKTVVGIYIAGIVRIDVPLKDVPSHIITGHLTYQCVWNVGIGGAKNIHQFIFANQPKIKGL